MNLLTDSTMLFLRYLPFSLVNILYRVSSYAFILGTATKRLHLSFDLGVAKLVYIRGITRRKLRSIVYTTSNRGVHRGGKGGHGPPRSDFGGGMAPPKKCPD